MATFDQFVIALEEPDGDVVVFDTAPTGRSLRELAMPFDWAGFLQKQIQEGKELARLMNMDDDSFADLERDRQRYEAALNVLRDDSTTVFTLVLLPERLPIEETRSAISGLDRLGIPVKALVINQRLDRKSSKVTASWRQGRSCRLAIWMKSRPASHAWSGRACPCQTATYRMSRRFAGSPRHCTASDRRNRASTGAVVHRRSSGHADSWTQAGNGIVGVTDGARLPGGVAPLEEGKGDEHRLRRQAPRPQEARITSRSRHAPPTRPCCSTIAIVFRTIVGRDKLPRRRGMAGGGEVAPRVRLPLDDRNGMREPADRVDRNLHRRRDLRPARWPGNGRPRPRVGAADPVAPAQWRRARP